MITYARDHSVADGLNYVATWNAAMLLSADLAEAGLAQRPGEGGLGGLEQDGAVGQARVEAPGEAAGEDAGRADVAHQGFQHAGGVVVPHAVQDNSRLPERNSR